MATTQETSERDGGDRAARAVEQNAAPSPQTGQDRSFEARYGQLIVGRGIAAIPTLLLRHQNRLRLRDGHAVLITTILSFYLASQQWPSVSIERMAQWRGVPWKSVESEVKELEALGYLTRPGRDPRHGGSYFFDLSPLLNRLDRLASAEGEAETLRREQARVLDGALLDLSTNAETNREQQQKTESENPKESENKESHREPEQKTKTDDVRENADRERKHSKETERQKPLTEDASGVPLLKAAAAGIGNPLETKPVSKLFRYVVTAKGSKSDA